MYCFSKTVCSSNFQMDIHDAAEKGKIDELKKLIASGVDIETKNNDVGACWCVIYKTGWLTCV